MWPISAAAKAHECGQGHENDVYVDYDGRFRHAQSLARYRMFDQASHVSRPPLRTPRANMHVHSGGRFRHALAPAMLLNVRPSAGGPFRALGATDYQAWHVRPTLNEHAQPFLADFERRATFERTRANSNEPRHLGALAAARRGRPTPASPEAAPATDPAPG